MNRMQEKYIEILLTNIKELNDISEVYICKNSNLSNIVLVVEDTTKEHILDYYEFLFELRDKYEGIHDFMIIDKEYRNLASSMYEETNCIYKRG